jgi:predicted  nucleic acid-binding Zn ribbon protein
MLFTKIKFGRIENTPKESVESAVENYLCTLLRAGQIGENPTLAWIKNTLHAHVLIPGLDSHQLQYHSEQGKKALEEIVTIFGHSPSWICLDDKSRTPPTSWQNASTLYLFTHAFDNSPPVCRGDGKGVISTYSLPLSFEQKEDLRNWQLQYKSRDNLWLECGPFEIAAYRQLANPKSKLSKWGRNLCYSLEKATKIPTYYYLMRFWGRKDGEQNRLCPGCGLNWNTNITTSNPQFWQFEFRCEKCRLVSHIGTELTDNPRVVIGEYIAPPKSKASKKLKKNK